ncbi:MAG TPA: helix-turn-helix domain-containing protein [Gemmatimonadota bacterium]|nr:helix-turn-helix domain-containing protein [Gemmatimonadota bacterium]
MDETQTVLVDLGFSEYEARAYTALVEGGSMNGYELARASGIPRANVYGVAAKLVERGAAHRVDTPEGTRYRAVTPAALVRKVGDLQRRTLGRARRALSRLRPREEPPAVLNLEGDEVLSRAREVIDGARRRLEVGIQPAEAGMLAESLRAASERGVGILTLCMERCPTECGGCQGDIHRYDLSADRDGRWLLIVADGRTALVGALGPDTPRGVLTEEPLLRGLISSYIARSLTLATLADAGGKELLSLLTEPVRRVLDPLYPGGDVSAYLADLSAGS